MSEGISLLPVTLYLGAHCDEPLGLLSIQSFNGFVQGRKGIFEKSSFSSAQVLSMSDKDILGLARVLQTAVPAILPRPRIEDVERSIRTVRAIGILVRIQRLDFQGFLRPVVDQHLGTRMSYAEETTAVLVVSGILGLCWDP